MDEIVKKVVGGAVVLVIGGTSFAVSQTDIVDNFSKETGMTKEQAAQYVEDTQGELDSFSAIGQDFIKEGSSTMMTASSIDCENYIYEWESDNLSCATGKQQLHIIGKSYDNLGNCYVALDTDLGSAARAKINECINAIDTLNNNYNLAIAPAIFDSSVIAEARNTNLYNKSVLKAAIESN